MKETEGYSIILLCDIASISRSTYYNWLCRETSVRELENKEIIKEMIVIHDKVEAIYGYRRMKLNINRIFGKNYNNKRIYRLMKLIGIKSIIRRKKKNYKRSDPAHIADNLLNREFTAEKPNEKMGN